MIPMLQFMLKSFLNEQFCFMLIPKISCVGNSKLPASAECSSGGILELCLNSTPFQHLPHHLTLSILQMITIFCYILCNCSIFPFLDQFDQALTYCILMPPSSSRLSSEPMTQSLLSKNLTQFLYKVDAQILVECRE